MKNLKPIRERLGLTQQALAAGIGCTQGNIGHYERGQLMPKPRAERLISFAQGLGLQLSYDHVYGDVALPDLVQTGAIMVPVVAPPCDAKYPVAAVATAKRAAVE